MQCIIPFAQKQKSMAELAFYISAGGRKLKTDTHQSNPEKLPEDDFHKEKSTTEALSLAAPYAGKLPFQIP